MLGFLEAAKSQVGGDFYRSQLVDLLTEQVQARME
jgi:hypothetical protein